MLHNLSNEFFHENDNRDIRERGERQPTDASPLSCMIIILIKLLTVTHPQQDLA